MGEGNQWKMTPGLGDLLKFLAKEFLAKWLL
jgi:hypothetical protein